MSFNSSPGSPDKPSAREDPVGEQELYSLCEGGKAERVEEWLKTHTSKEERYKAANYQGKYNAKALHHAARTLLPSRVIKDIVACCPDAVRQPDSFGWLPIHYACANASGNVLAIFSVLIDTYPQSVTAQDRRGRTPLHFFCSATSKVVGSETVELVHLLIRETQAVRLADESGLLPIHYACAYMGGPFICEVLEVLREPYPESIAAQDYRGRTPLHFVLSNANRDASPEVVRFLLLHGAEYNITNIKDKDGRLPLDQMKAASEVHSNYSGARSNLQECLPIVIDALQDLPDEGFIVLQSLPPWLQAEAFKNPGHGLQSALNAHISKQFPTMILMLDFYFSVTLIACFQLVSTKYLDCIFDNKVLSDAYLTPYLEMVLICGIYFLIREMTQIISLGSAGLLKRVWLRDVTNLIDIISVAVTFMWFTLMKLQSCESQKDASKYSDGGEWYRVGMTLTIGLYWLSFLLLLRAMSPSFAVFMGGMFHVIRSLVLFLIFLGITLVAFAQMFFVVFRETSFCQCRDDYSGVLGEAQEEACAREPDYADGASFCTFRESLLQVYFMLAGEFDPDVVTYSPLSTFLACLFIFLAVILLLNVLIAIVTNAYIFVQDTNSAKLFWSQRFAFLAEVKAITVFTRGCLRFGRRDRKSDEDVDPALQLHGNYEDRARELWRQAVLIIGPNLYEDANCCENLVYFLVGIFIFLALVLWVLAGIVTVGLLWPPQVREWLLQQHMSTSQHTNSKGTTAALTNFVTKDQYQELKDEVSQVRKQNEDISRQSAEIKELLLSVLSQNAKEVTVRLDNSSYAPI